MRRLVLIFLASLAALGAGGCGEGTPSSADQVVTLSTHAPDVAARRRAASIRQLRAELRRVRRSPHRSARPDVLSAPSTPSTPGSTDVREPPIVQRPIPFGPDREQEMAAYARRHYGIDDYRLRDPKVIVEHYTAGPTAASAIATFTPDVADSELHELPGVCAHFVIDRDGTIYQLVPLGIMCRHTVGLNYTAIGIEHAGFSDQDVLGNPPQLAASMALTRWLRCRYGIPVHDVIGHNESLSSPYHHELVASLRSQTHGDWVRADMDVYRSRLTALGC